MKQLYLRYRNERVESRPFTGAWIETLPFVRNWAWSCRPFTGAWIETSARAALLEVWKRRPFTGAWIETDAPRPA